MDTTRDDARRNDQQGRDRSCSTDDRPLTVYCHSDGSGFGFACSGGQLAPHTGYVDAHPTLTVDIDTGGRILDVGFGLISESNALAVNIESSIERFYDEDLMIWHIAFPNGTLLDVDEDGTYPAAGALAETLSFGFRRSPDGQFVELDVCSHLTG